MTDPALTEAAPTESAPQAAPAAAPQTEAPPPAPAGDAATVDRAAWTQTLVINLLSFLVVALPGAYYFKLGFELRAARTVALMAPIPWPFYLASLLAALGLAVFVVTRAMRGERPGSPTFRLMPIAAVLFVSAEIFAVSPATLPMPPDSIIAFQLHAFEEDGLVTDDGLLPADPALFARLLPELRPPFLRDGEQMSAWNFVVRTDCEGAITELPAGVEAGTIMVCLAADRRSAWLSAVGMGAAYAGAPQLVTEPGVAEPIAVRIEAIGDDEARQEAAEGLYDVPADEPSEDSWASPGEP